jgi:hypothetical protein
MAHKSEQLSRNIFETTDFQLMPTLEVNCMQPQQEVTEWIDMYACVFQRNAEGHEKGL